jgi:hypothetical protein
MGIFYIFCIFVPRYGDADACGIGRKGIRLKSGTVPATVKSIYPGRIRLPLPNKKDGREGASKGGLKSGNLPHHFIGTKVPGQNQSTHFCIQNQ